MTPNPQQAQPNPLPNTQSKVLITLLNAGHGVDHLFLLIFASAVSSIALDFGFEKWEDLMPYGAWAFLMFGLGSIPCGRLGDIIA